MDLWECEEPVSKFGIEVPAWIEPDISSYQVAAIAQGGCASGAYMPAVTYYKANETMAEHGDAVLEWLEGCDILPAPDMANMSWSGLACFYLSMAVDLWALNVEQELLDLDD